jgi:hypothetical protein
MNKIFALDKYCSYLSCTLEQMTVDELPADDMALDKMSRRLCSKTFFSKIFRMINGGLKLKEKVVRIQFFKNISSFSVLLNFGLRKLARERA